VETLVADPAFAHTRIGQSLVELADKWGFDLSGTVDSAWPFGMYQLTSADRRCPRSQGASPEGTASWMQS